MGDMPDDVRETGESPPTGTTEADCPCTRCGYNLRGLAESGNCPECAAPVELSLRGDLLRYANPQWVRRLALACVFLVATQVLFVATLLVPVGLFLFAYQSAPRLLQSTVTRVVTPVSVIGVASLCAGSLLLLARQGRATADDPAVPVRRVVQVAVALLLACLCLSQVQYWGQWRSSSLSIATTITSALAWVTCHLFALWFLGLLARRIPAAKLADALSTVRWAYCVVYLLRIGSLHLYVAAFNLGWTRGWPGPWLEALGSGVASGIAWFLLVAASVAVAVTEWSIGRQLYTQFRLARGLWDRLAPVAPAGR